MGGLESGRMFKSASKSTCRRFSHHVDVVKLLETFLAALAVLFPPQLLIESTFFSPGELTCQESDRKAERAE